MNNNFKVHRNINKDVNSILSFITPNTVGIEIGVWAGDTSEKFINRGVKHLHLVDSWSVEAYLTQKNPEKGSNEKRIMKNIYCCGEHYSEKFQQWMEGALETSNKVLERLQC